MEFGSFPKNLAYNVKTLSGFSKTIVKMTPTPNTAVSAGQTLKVRLPSNSLVDLRTLRVRKMLTEAPIWQSNLVQC